MLIPKPIVTVVGYSKLQLSTDFQRFGPRRRQQFGLLQHQIGSGFLQIGRVAVFAQDALHQHANLGPRTLLDRPVDRDVLAYLLHQFDGDHGKLRSPMTCLALSLAASAS